MSNSKTNLSIVVAMTLKGGIGYQNALPWNLPTDMKHFKQITTQGNQGNVVIMGRKTFESMGSKPLPKRENIVISKTMKSDSNPSIKVFPSIDESISYCNQIENANKKVFVIGGKQIIEESLSNSSCSEVHLTRIGKDIPCDVHLKPDIFNHLNVNKTSRTYSENSINFDFQHLVNSQAYDDSFITNKHQEHQYLSLIEKIMNDGTFKDDRTGVGTISLFGESMRFDLQHSFPLITTKKVFFRGVVEELLWFIRGDTDGKILLDKKIKIWEGNGTRQYLDSIHLTNRKEHDLGPIYGFQWRHFGAKYYTCHTNYRGQGEDQLKEVINQLKHNPNSRRIIMSAWNPMDIKQMALPPCHVMSQFYVSNNKLSCLMYQRSCDVGLGVPFNIASYALLTCLLAKECNLERGELVHILGDTHIYKNHVDQLKSQIQRTPFPFPILEIKADKKIEDYEYSDFELIGYNAHDKIEMKMAV